MYNNVSLIISSCDAYKELVDNFLLLFKKFFKDFDGPMFSTLSDDINFDEGSIKGIGIENSNKSFSDRLLICLDKVETEYVLFFLDDFYLLKPVNINLFNSAINILNRDSKVKTILLHDEVGSKYVCDNNYNEYFDVKNNKTPYLCTSQAMLWRIDFFKQIIRRNESAWEFEQFGSYRMRHKKGIHLYRDDKFADAISYPYGGVCSKGKINSKIKYFKDYDFYDSLEGKIYYTPKNIKKNKVKFLFKYLLGYFYPFFSRFMNIKRYGEGTPKYVARCNSYAKYIKQEQKAKLTEV